MDYINTVLHSRWEDAIPLLPEGSIDLIVSDPPYKSTPQDWDKERPEWRSFMGEMGRISTPSAQMWLFVRMPWAIDVFLSALSCGWIFVQERIWVKQNAGGCTVRGLRKVHENLWHFKKKGAKTFNSEAIREPKTTVGDKSVRRRAACTTQFMGTNNSRYIDDGKREPKSVIYCPNLHMSKESVGHPTQKPLKVIEPLILYSSNEGDLVLDPFSGSGTTLVAAQMHGRRWLGIEQDAKWVGKSVARLKDSGQGNKGVFEE
jgi:site-specific DNA-methyltransferase (adenine-specific)